MSNKEKETWASLIGKTILVTPTDGETKFYLEYKVLGVSPSGSKINMENRAGRNFWCDSDEYSVIEVIK